MNYSYDDLTKKEKQELEGYTGKRHELCDGKGNILKVTDTRTARGTYLVTKQMLKTLHSEKYQDAYSQHKIDRARMGTLDAEEGQEIMDFDIKMSKEYELRKSMMKDAFNAGDMDAIEDAGLNPAYKLVDDKLTKGE